MTALRFVGWWLAASWLALHMVVVAAVLLELALVHSPTLRTARLW